MIRSNTNRSIPENSYSKETIQYRNQGIQSSNVLHSHQSYSHLQARKDSEQYESPHQQNRYSANDVENHPQNNMYEPNQSETSSYKRRSQIKRQSVFRTPGFAGFQKTYNSRVNSQKSDDKSSERQIESQVKPFERQTSRLYEESQRQAQGREPNYKSQVSDVNSQIEILNRLREQYEHIKYDQVVEAKEEERKSAIKSVRGQSKSHLRAVKIDGEGTTRRDLQKDEFSEEQNDEVAELITTQSHHGGTQNTMTIQYLAELTKMQHALTQATHKIQELLLQQSSYKERLQQMNSLIQKNNKLENELRLLKDSDAYNKIEIEMKNEEIKRLEKRLKSYSESIATLEKEGELKDRELSALQRAFISRSSEENKGHAVGSRMITLEDMQNQFEKARKQWERQYTNDRQRSNQQQVNQSDAKLKATAQNIKESLLLEEKNTMKREINLLQSRLINTQADLKSALFELETEQKKNATLTENFNFKISQIKESLNSKEENQSKEVKQLLAKLEQSEAQKFTTVNQEIERVRREMSSLKEKSTAETQSYIELLEGKVSNFQKLIQQENNQKQRFVEDVTKMKCSYDKAREKNRQLKESIKALQSDIGVLEGQKVKLAEENDQKSKQNYRLEGQLIELKREVSQMKASNAELSEFRQQNLHREKEALKSEIEVIKNLKALQSSNVSAANTHALNSEKLSLELSHIKGEYRKLEASFMDLARSHKESKLLHQKMDIQLEEANMAVEYLEKELGSRNQVIAKLSRALEENELKLIDLLSISEASKSHEKRVLELNEKIFALQVKISQKEHEMANVQSLQKKELQRLQEHQNNKLFEASQQIADYSKESNDLHQKLHQSEQQLQALEQESELLRNEVKEIEKLYKGLNEENQQSSQKHIETLEKKLYEMYEQKEKLIMQNNQLLGVEHQFRELKSKQRKNIRHSEAIEHLWMVKEAEYANIHKVIGLSKNSSHGHAHPENRKSRADSQVEYRIKENPERVEFAGEGQKESRKGLRQQVQDHPRKQSEQSQILINGPPSLSRQTSEYSD